MNTYIYIFCIKKTFEFSITEVNYATTVDGEISSPNFPFYYHNNQDCYHHITAPNNQSVVSFNFTSFTLEDCVDSYLNCTCDWLQVCKLTCVDWLNAILIQIFSDKHFNRVEVSFVPHMILKK